MAEENNVSNWFQDNLRIIISIGIVILLVFAIYSYSQRSSRTDVVVDDSEIEEVAMESEESGNEINEIIDEIRDDQTAVEETEVPTAAKIEEDDVATESAIENDQETPLQQMEEEEIAQEQTELEEEQVMMETQEEATQAAENIVREVIESRSTQQQIQQVDGMITVVAVHGDSMTTLARKAAHNYINNNNLNDLTPSHKIYIEDYLRKMKPSQRIFSGTEMTFSETDIATAVEHARQLTDAQLNNLARYAQKVPSL